MTDETTLLPCPFCGCNPMMQMEDNGMFRVTCTNPDCIANNDLWWETYDEAVEAWNTRYEPTCRIEKTDDDVDWHPVEHECKRCAGVILTYQAPPKHCTWCGAKVIEE